MLLPASFSGHERNHLFLNRFGEQFADISGVSGLDYDGDSRAFAVFDYDRDGWLDLAVVNANAPMLQLFRNQMGDMVDSSDGAILALRFVGGNHAAVRSDGWSNRDGIGVMVEVETSNLNLIREHRGGEGLAAQNSPVMLIGVGPADHARSLKVTWPSGRVQTLRDVPTGTLLTVHENPEQSPTGEPFVRGLYRNSPDSSPLQQEFTSLQYLDTQLDLAAPAPASGLRLFMTMATWCPSCKLWQDQLNNLASTFDPTELLAYGVPIDPNDTAEMLDDYIREYQPAYTLLRDLDAGEVQATQQVGIDIVGFDALPTTIVTGDSGRVLLSVVGVPTRSEIARLIREQAGPQNLNSLAAVN